METVKYNLDTALRNAIKEINERMVSIETDIKRIRKAREGEKDTKDTMHKARDMVWYDVLHIGPEGPKENAKMYTNVKH